MKKTSFLILLAAFSLNAFGWGQKGHDTVAFIAQNHLSEKSKAAIDSLLEGKSMVYWANWLDNASHTPEYAYSKTWHYKNIDADKTFENAPKIPEGNIVDALYEQVNILGNPDVDKSEKGLALKMVIHFLGDIHQPLHMGHATDRGGNSHQVYFFKKPTNLHSIWDSDILESAHKWSHTEWQREIDNLPFEEIYTIISGGNPNTWAEETYEICKNIYESTPQDYTVSYDYVAQWAPTVEQQLVKGGLRLADVLNSIFDPEYIPLNSFTTR